jgi:O-antigen/teichoic acid export membrane protein
MIINRNIKDSLWYSIGGVINKVSVFLLLPFYTNFFSKEDYAILSIVVILTTISNHLISYAFNSALLRAFYDYEKENIGKLIFTVSIDSTKIFILLFSLTIIINTFFDNTYFHYIYFILLYSLFFSLSCIALNFLKYKRRVKEFTYYNLLKTLLEIVFIIVFVSILVDGVFGKIIGSLFSFFLIYISLYYIVIKDHIILNYQKDISKDYFKLSAPLVLNNIVGWSLVSYDQLLFENNFGLEKFAILTLAIQICSIYKYTIDGFLQAFKVYIFEKIKNFNYDVKELYLFLISLFSFFALFIVTFDNYIILILSNNGYLESSNVIKYYIFSRLIMTINSLLVVFLLIDKKSKIITNSTFISLVIMLVFSTILIPNYGVIGAAIASSITFLSRNIYLSFKLSKSLKFISLKYIVILIIFLLTMSLYIVFSPNFLNKLLILIMFSILLIRFNFKYLKKNSL